MKHVGLNVAADPLFTMSYHGRQRRASSSAWRMTPACILVPERAGLPPLRHRCQGPHAGAFGQPGGADLCQGGVSPLRGIRHARSLLRMCTRISHSQSIVEKGARQEVPKREYVKDPLRVMMTSQLPCKAHHRVEERTAAHDGAGRDHLPQPHGDGEGYLHRHHHLFHQLSIRPRGLWRQSLRAEAGPVLVRCRCRRSRTLPPRWTRSWWWRNWTPIIENHCRQIGVEVSGKDCPAHDRRADPGGRRPAVSVGRRRRPSRWKTKFPAVRPSCAPDVPTGACSTPCRKISAWFTATSAATPWASCRP